MRGRDLNPRPLGYEPNELPDCSTPLDHRMDRGKVCQASWVLRVWKLELYSTAEGASEEAPSAASSSSMSWAQRKPIPYWDLGKKALRI